MGSQWDLTDIDDIEILFRQQFMERAENNCYVVRFLGVSGDLGQRCLTFNVDANEQLFAPRRDFIEEVVSEIRTRGFEVDELLQKVPCDGNFDVRFWLIIYEAPSHGLH